MPHVTAILVTYNSASVLSSALMALRGQPDIASIVVVDNHSDDGTVALVRREFPTVQLIENPANYGYGRGNNVALETVTTPFALIVNPDAVMQPGAVAALLAAAQRYPDAAILAPTLYDEENHPHRSHNRCVFDREERFSFFRSRRREKDRTVPSGDLCAEFLSGAVWLLNMPLAAGLGFFDPNIFLYYEDDDLCLRARQRGHALVLVHDAAALHGIGRSSGAANPAAEFSKQKFMIWSRLYIEKKYRGAQAARQLARALWIEYVYKSARSRLLFKTKKLARYRGRLEGIQEFKAHSGT